jgi:hypothetical protein
VKADGGTSTAMSRYCVLSSANVDRATMPSGKENPSSTTAPAAPTSRDAQVPTSNVVTPTNATVPRGATPNDPLADAQNRDQVMQYADMNRVPPTPARIMAGVPTTVRSSPRGDQVQVLGTGTTVNVVAKRADYDLILYPDPKDTTKRLAGWVYKDAVDAANWPPIAATSKTKSPGAAQERKSLCEPGESELRSAGELCARTCTKDAECTNLPGGLCDGVAYSLNKDGSTATTMTRYCVGPSEGADESNAKPTTPRPRK